MSAATAVCTIASANYLARARVLMESVACWHPEWERYLLLIDPIDPIDGRLDPEVEPFRIVPIGDLPLSGLRRLCFRYSLLELATAVKPARRQRISPFRQLESPPELRQACLSDGAREPIRLT